MATWCAISTLRQTREPQFFWQHLLGVDFEKVRPFLVPCVGVAGTYIFCPVTGIRLELRESRGEYRAGAVGEHAEDADDRALTWEEAQAWKIDPARLRMALCEALGLAGVSDDEGETADVQLIGFCERHGERRRVYLCHAPNSESAVLLAADAAHTPNAGCILFPERHLAAEHVLNGRGVACVALSDCVTWCDGKWAGACGQLCQVCEKKDNGTAVILGEIRDEIATVARQKREIADESAERQATISEMSKGVDRFVAGLRGQLSKPEMDLFLLLTARVMDGERTRVLSYAEMGKRLGKITKQAIGFRVKQLYEQHPKVRAFVQGERKAATPAKFSELSPSARREQGIDEVYGQNSRSRAVVHRRKDSPRHGRGDDSGDDDFA